MRVPMGIALAFCIVGCNAPPDDRLPDHQPGRIVGAVDVGPVERDQMIEVVLAVRLRDPEGADNILTTGRRFSPAEYGDSFGATRDDYQRVLAWCAERDLEIVRTSPSRTTVTVRGSTATLENAFSTQLRYYEDSRGRFRSPGREIRVATELDGLVAGTVGLDDAARWKSKRRDLGPIPEPNLGPGGSYEPAELRAQYQVNDPAVTERGDGETIAILGTGFAPRPMQDVDSFVTRYLTSFATNRAAQYSIVLVGGPNRDSDTLANNEYGENVLDIDMVLAFAPRANVVHVHTAENTPGLFADGIVYIVNNVPQAHAVSVSYGTCERYANSEILVMNTLFKQAKAQGQTWFIASGDNGTDGCRDGKGNKVLVVDWPASSPYVIGVGGTEIGTPPEEVAWDGSGGGQSEANAKPAYQVGVGPHPNDGARQVPDVAAIGGPTPGVTVVFGNQRSASAGTSASAPMWAGIWALLDQRKGRLGITNAHERLYQLGKAGSTVFHDVTKGGNMDPNGSAQGFPALPGYDLATGWGTPNVKELLAQY
jgi:kumamolisin